MLTRTWCVPEVKIRKMFEKEKQFCKIINNEFQQT